VFRKRKKKEKKKEREETRDIMAALLSTIEASHIILG
jgi:hypothetical protein